MKELAGFATSFNPLKRGSGFETNVTDNLFGKLIGFNPLKRGSGFETLIASIRFVD